MLVLCFDGIFFCSFIELGTSFFALNNINKRKHGISKLGFISYDNDSVHLISLRGLKIDKFGIIHRGGIKCCGGCYKSLLVIKDTYVAYLKVAVWFAFALCNLIAFMVYWTEAHSEPCQTSKM